jgi:hypothetical protein
VGEASVSLELRAGHARTRVKVEHQGNVRIVVPPDSVELVDVFA